MTNRPSASVLQHVRSPWGQDWDRSEAWRLRRVEEERERRRAEEEAWRRRNRENERLWAGWGENERWVGGVGYPGFGRNTRGTRRGILMGSDSSDVEVRGRSRVRR